LEPFTRGIFFHEYSTSWIAGERIGFTAFAADSRNGEDGDEQYFHPTSPNDKDGMTQPRQIDRSSLYVRGSCRMRCRDAMKSPPKAVLASTMRIVAR
jgi:hypothetical protein